MKLAKQTRRDARQLYRLCLVNGLLDEGRLRQVVQRISESRNRIRLNVLSEIRRLVKLDCTRHSATVECATLLPFDMQASIEAGLSRLYGPGLKTSFIHDAALIGGMRIKVGSDVYDGSVKARLAALEAAFQDSDAPRYVEQS